MEAGFLWTGLVSRFFRFPIEKIQFLRSFSLEIHGILLPKASIFYECPLIWLNIICTLLVNDMLNLLILNRLQYLHLVYSSYDFYSSSHIFFLLLSSHIYSPCKSEIQIFTFAVTLILFQFLLSFIYTWEIILSHRDRTFYNRTINQVRNKLFFFHMVIVSHNSIRLTYYCFCYILSEIIEILFYLSILYKKELERFCIFERKIEYSFFFLFKEKIQMINWAYMIENIY